MEPVTQQKNVVIEMVLPMGRALMVMVFVASVSFKKAIKKTPFWVGISNKFWSFLSR